MTVSTNMAGGRTAAEWRVPEFDERAGAEADNEATLRAFGESVAAKIAEMQTQREQWRDTLHELYEAEVRQEARALALEKQVLRGEAEALANPGFHRWMREREEHGVGAEGLAAWYDNDALLAATPFLAVVPFPRQLTAAGWDEVVQTVDSLLQDAGLPRFAVEAWPVGTATRGQLALADDEAAAATQAEMEARQRAAFTSRTIASGEELRALHASDAALRAFLEETPCLFLNTQKAVADRNCNGVSMLRVVVVRGACLACEPYAPGGVCTIADVEELRPKGSATGAPPHGSSKSGMTLEGTTPLGADTTGFLKRLQSWVASTLDAALPERSFTAVVCAQCAVEGGDAVSVSFHLLGLSPLDASGTRHFAWSDLVGLTVSADMARSRRLDWEQRQRQHEEAGTVEFLSPPPGVPALQFRGSWALLPRARLGAPATLLPPKPAAALAGPPFAAAANVQSDVVIAAPAPSAASSVAAARAVPSLPAAAAVSSGGVAISSGAAVAACVVACAASVVAGVVLGRRSK